MDSEQYEHNDDDMDYNEEVKEIFFDSFDFISEGVDAGIEIGGTILGIPGVIAEAIFGGMFGCVKGILDAVFYKRPHGMAKEETDCLLLNVTGELLFKEGAAAWKK